MSNVYHLANCQQRLQSAIADAVVEAIRAEYERGTRDHLIIAGAPAAIVSGIMSGLLTIDRNAPGIMTADVVQEIEASTVRQIKDAFQKAMQP